MNTEITGHCYVCGDNVTVYQVIPENRWTMKKMDGTAMSEWLFETYEPGLENLRGGFKSLGLDVIIAGKNFGCGSKTVEHPIAALKGAGIKMILADSFSRYSYRNAINLAIPVMICPGITEFADRGDEIRVDMLTGCVENLTQKRTCSGQPLGEFATGIILNGGLLAGLKG